MESSNPLPLGYQQDRQVSRLLPDILKDQARMGGASLSSADARTLVQAYELALSQAAAFRRITAASQDVSGSHPAADPTPPTPPGFPLDVDAPVSEPTAPPHKNKNQIPDDGLVIETMEHVGDYSSGDWVLVPVADGRYELHRTETDAFDEAYIAHVSGPDEARRLIANLARPSLRLTKES